MAIGAYLNILGENPECPDLFLNAISLMMK